MPNILEVYSLGRGDLHLASIYTVLLCYSWITQENVSHVLIIPVIPFKWQRCERVYEPKKRAKHLAFEWLQYATLTGWSTVQLGKWKWTGHHRRSWAENTCSFDTNAAAEVSVGLRHRTASSYVHDLCSSLHTVTSAFGNDMERSLFTMKHESFVTGFKSSLLKSPLKGDQMVSVRPLSIDAGYNTRVGQKYCAWTGAGVLQWMEVEHFRLCGRSRSQSESRERFGGRWQGLTRTLAGFDWRWPLNWTRAAGCCPPRDSAFSIWFSCSGTRSSPASRLDSETGPGSVFHILTGTESCGTCSPEPPVARTWRPSWHAWAWRRPARSAGVCAVQDHAGWLLDLHRRASRRGRSPLPAPGRGAAGQHRAPDAWRSGSVHPLLSLE